MPRATVLDTAIQSPEPCAVPCNLCSQLQTLLLLYRQGLWVLSFKTSQAYVVSESGVPGF